MMHHNSITVAITNDDKKPYREYGFKKLHDKCKTSEVILPFDSNYQILIKNDNFERIQMSIDIDGTIISGSGLIVPAASQCYIERFVETAKKLLFVKKTNEKVADPTNKENGFLTIKFCKENTHRPLYNQSWLDQPIMNRADFYPHNSWPNGNSIYDSPPISTYSYKATPTSGILRCSSINTSHDVGATVEGATSNQIFESTTWLGDRPDSDFIFQFKMLGTELDPQEAKDLMEYKRLKAKFEKTT